MPTKKIKSMVMPNRAVQAAPRASSLTTQRNGVAADVTPGITRIPGVCGGDPCIGHTRIPVWVIFRARQLGALQKNIREMYPSLTIQQIRQALRWADLHREEMDRNIEENEGA